MTGCETREERIGTVQSATKEYRRKRSVVIPPLMFNGSTEEPQGGTGVTRNIPPGSIVLAPHTPTGDDNPCDILNQKLSDDVKRKMRVH